MLVTHPRRQIILILLAVLLANAGFLALTLAGYLTPAPVAERVITAFAQGELGDQDYLRYDSHRGFHQYNDCVILQMLYHRDPRSPAFALAPTTYWNDDGEMGQCELLYTMVTGSAQPETLVKWQYARYWHGYNALIVFGLKFFEIGVLRKLLTVGAWLAVGLLAFISYKSGWHVRRAGLCIAASALIFWALPYFAPSFTHGPGDTLVLLGVAVLALWAMKTPTLAFLLPYAAVFGSAVVFMEMLTGQLPVAAAWIAVMALAVIRDKGLLPGKNGYQLVLYALIAFGVGAVLTVLIKQLLAYAVIDPDAVDVFSGHLRLYMSIPEPRDGIPGFLLAFGRMAQKFSVLVYGRTRIGYLILALVGLTWITNLLLAYRNRHNQFGKDAAAMVLIASIPLLWILLLQTHTYIHAEFMVRILVVPISLAPLPFLWKRSSPLAEQ